ncbi:MAG: homocysteine S-methyltransferase family protein [Ignavibacteriales bacterium]|nr:homocysteine S-methyltransferase family protein [Ignavibacteriales bacterium]
MMPSSVLELLSKGKILISDGAMGTELQKRGLPTGGCPEEFNVTHSDIITAIHADYFAAGADIVETNTFGANRIRLSRSGYGERVVEFCTSAVQNARKVCPAGKFVGGSIGPTGEMLEPYGEVSIMAAYDAFAEQARALAAAGVDLFFVETMMSIEEAETAVKATKDAAAIPVVATMTFEASESGIHTMWGVDIPTAVERLTAAGADILGANCGRGFDEMVEIIKVMRPLTSKPIIAQANAGLPELVDGRSAYRETPENIAPKAQQLLTLGINIIGGCCGTGPAHIRKLRELIS